MSKVSLIEVEIDKRKSNHMFYSNEDSNCLVVVFPGGNNSCDRPILHYLRKYFLDKNCDVLCISYMNLVERKDPYDEKLEKLIFGINSAILKIEKEKQYPDKIFVSRSFGNIVSSELKIKHFMDIKKSIYISPTSPAIKYINEHPGFIVTSSNDEYLTNDEITELRKLETDQILIFENGYHGLETNDISETMDFHRSAVRKIISFLEK